MRLNALLCVMLRQVEDSALPDGPATASIPYAGFPVFLQAKVQNSASNNKRTERKLRGIFV